MEETNLNTNQPTTPTPEVSGDQGEKMFTQSDLDRIVSERLARAKKDKATDERETALKARESRLDCRDFLSDKKYPAKLLDILDTTDAESFKSKVELLADLFRSMEDTTPAIVMDMTAPLGSGPSRKTSAISDAFKPPKI